MRVGRRISISALNTNINADLNLGCGNVLYATAMRCPTACATGCYVHHDTLNDYFTVISGGTLANGKAARLFLAGSTYAGTPGDIGLSVPNAAANNDLNVATFHGNTDTPYLEMWSRRITSLAQATTDMDAAPVTKVWVAWTPTIVWTGGTPASLTITCRYTQIARIVFFQIYINSADSNACTNCTITLPSTPANTGTHHAVSCRQTYGVAGITYATISYYVTQDGSETRLMTNQFNACTDAQTVQLMLSGFYEV